MYELVQDLLILNSITFVRILDFCNVFLSYNLKKLGQGSSKIFAFSAIMFSPHFPPTLRPQKLRPQTPTI